MGQPLPPDADGRCGKDDQTPAADVLTYFKHHVTNVVSEGFNSRIQNLASNARGPDTHVK